jgi:hypothetical protein
MNHQRATELIERYFAGETSPQEEADLHTYFRSDNVAPELTTYTPLFQYWERERQIKAPARVARLRPRRRLPRRLIGIAAGIALLLVANWIHRLEEPHVTDFPVAERQAVDWSRYEITDEEEALEFVRSVLKSTSSNLQQGPRITLRELREVHEILD